MNTKSEQKLTYPIGLLLSTPKRKTFESMGREIGISGDTVSRLVEHNAATMKDLIQIVKNACKRRRLRIIIDDTLIMKIYSKIIEGTDDNYSPSDGSIHRSLCTVVAIITDGRFVIPITHDIWASKELNKENHQTKWQIAQQLIEEIHSELPIYELLADGLYAIHEFFLWLISKNIKFDMRFHSNRSVTDKDYCGQIKLHPKLKLSSKRPMRTICIKWKNIFFYVTAFRRINRSGETMVIYLISNYKASAREHVRAYELRWVIEKFFRTAKQYLGLGDCQSRKLNLQKNHIMNVFFIYALLQVERVKLKSKLKFRNIEGFIKWLNLYDFRNLTTRFMRSAENFGIA